PELPIREIALQKRQRLGLHELKRVRHRLTRQLDPENALAHHRERPFREAGQVEHGHVLLEAGIHLLARANDLALELPASINRHPKTDAADSLEREFALLVAVPLVARLV